MKQVKINFNNPAWSGSMGLFARRTRGFLRPAWHVPFTFRVKHVAFDEIEFHD
jgi:hypothetical protein